MNFKKNIEKLLTIMVMAVAFTLVSSASFATVDLVAIEGQWTPAGGAPITMWGFAADTGQACNSLPPWTVGPEITAAELQPNGRLRIKLRNCLDVPVSIIIPGQQAIVPGIPNAHPKPVKRSGRINSFTEETAPLSTDVYMWESVDQNPGAYLYMSGSHPALQVHMGLYGALKVGSYPGTGADVTLLYSEIDPDLHATVSHATPLNYKPKYYLVNGLDVVPPLDGGNAGQPTVLSFLNAGLDFHVPAMNSGEYMLLQAEDGNPYPYPKEQYSVTLAAGKTAEALWQATADGDHVIYDRRGNGMKVTLTVAPAPGP